MTDEGSAGAPKGLRLLRMMMMMMMMMILLPPNCHTREHYSGEAHSARLRLAAFRANAPRPAFADAAAARTDACLLPFTVIGRPVTRRAAATDFARAARLARAIALPDLPRIFCRSRRNKAPFRAVPLTSRSQGQICISKFVIFRQSGLSRTCVRKECVALAAIAVQSPSRPPSTHAHPLPYEH